MGLDLVTRSARDQHARPCILDVQVRTKSWLEIDGRFAIGPHGFELLFAIQRHDSLTRAARAIGWSYRRAWDYIRQAEKVFGAPLVSTRAGKGRARGSMLTPLGLEVLRVGATLQEPSRGIKLKVKRGDH
jgi:molybdate transport system regulatory protein